MKFTIIWDGQDDTADSYIVDRSVDGGLTYASLINIPRDPSSGFFNPNDSTYRVDDNSSAPGFIYRVFASGDAGLSEPVIVVVPPSEPLFCTVVGYVMDPFGAVDPTTEVRITYDPENGDTTTAAGGEIGNQAPRVVRTAGDRVFYPNSSGYWEAQLLQGTRVRIEIPDGQYTNVFVVPFEAGPVNVMNIGSLGGKQLSLYQPPMRIPKA